MIHRRDAENTERSTVMEELDLTIDCTIGQLIPREPEMMTSAMGGYVDITIVGHQK